MALGEVATRDFLRSELARAERDRDRDEHERDERERERDERERERDEREGAAS